METKILFAIPLLMIITLMTSGCIGEEPAAPVITGGQCLAPKIMIGEICCFDQNNNNICDMEEAGLWELLPTVSNGRCKQTGQKFTA